MFSFGLSDELAKAMQVIARNVPDVAAVVRAKMMDLISLILSGVPYRHPGTPARVVTQVRRRGRVECVSVWVCMCVRN